MGPCRDRDHGGAFVLEPYITVHVFGFSNRGVIQTRIVIERNKNRIVDDNSNPAVHSILRKLSDRFQLLREAVICTTDTGCLRGNGNGNGNQWQWQSMAMAINGNGNGNGDPFLCPRDKQSLTYIHTLGWFDLTMGISTDVQSRYLNAKPACLI